MKLSLSKAHFYILVFACILISIVLPFLLPGKFYDDADLIIKDPGNEKGFIGSYPLSMMFYSITRLSLLPYSIVALIQLPIVYYSLRKIGIPENFHVFNLKNGVIYLAFFMVAVFIGQPSKEFFTFLFVAFIVYLFQFHQFSIGVCLLFSFGLFGIFGAVFRPYFAFIPLIALGIYGITKIKFTNRWLLGVFNGILVIIFLSLSHGFVKGKYFSQMTREELNIARVGADNADTMIQSPVPTGTWYGEAIATVYGFVTVNFPINAIKFFYKPQVMAFVVWQLLLFWILIVRFGYLLKSYPERKKELWIMLFTLSYFVIQGIFEPDLGSAVRHKIGVLPLIYYVFYYDQFKRKVQ